MKYVNNLRQFLRHVTLHRRRVYRLGMEMSVFIRRPWILALVLLVHDLEKYPFLYHLWKYYGGKNGSGVALYTRMNKLGRLIQELVLLPFTLFDDMWYDIELAKKFEHIADVVDRNTDPVAMEEFNLQVQKPMSLFLRNKDLQLAEVLKKDWATITRGLHY